MLRTLMGASQASLDRAAYRALERRRIDEICWARLTGSYTAEELQQKQQLQEHTRRRTQAARKKEEEQIRGLFLAETEQKYKEDPAPTVDPELGRLPFVDVLFPLEYKPQLDRFAKTLISELRESRPDQTDLENAMSCAHFIGLMPFFLGLKSITFSQFADRCGKIDPVILDRDSYKRLLNNSDAPTMYQITSKVFGVLTTSFPEIFATCDNRNEVEKVIQRLKNS